MVASDYVWGTLEYATGAWLPAASESHLELVDRELRASRDPCGDGLPGVIIVIMYFVRKLHIKYGFSVQVSEQ